VPTALLQARQLFCEREERVLFARLDFSLQAGELLQIEGPNGAGKTTLMRSVTGFHQHFEGEVLWRGQPLASDREAFYAETLILGHQTGIKLPLSPTENLRWIASVRGVGLDALDKRIAESLDAVGLAGFEHQPAQSLSAGQKRRIALARLFIEPATLWVLDEPFSAIDKQGVSVLETLLVDHVSRGGAALIVTHHDMQLPGIRHRRLMLGQGNGGQWQLS
jgi:heme exporter protein A